MSQYSTEHVFPGNAEALHRWQQLKTVLDSRIQDDLTGMISTKNIGQILDEELAPITSEDPADT